MKNKINLIIMVCLLIAGLSITSCKKEIYGCTDSSASNYNKNATNDDGSCKYCNGFGTLRLTNTSVHTIQQILVDGINYGTLDPGFYKEISLAAGSHRYRLSGISGGGGCSEATVIIVQCQTQGFSCSY